MMWISPVLGLKGTLLGRGCSQGGRWHVGTEVRHLEDPLGSQQRHSSTPLSKAPWREPQITAAPVMALWLPRGRHH